MDRHNAVGRAVLFALTITWTAGATAAAPDVMQPRDVPPKQIAKGFYLPYPLKRVFRGFSACRAGQHTHRAIDIGGIGPHDGLGTPIRAVVRSLVIVVAKSSQDAAHCGTPDRRSGKAKRGRKLLPRQMKHPTYGKVYFFTEDAGRWRTGNLVELVGVGGPYHGYRFRYMHMAAVHPDLGVGDLVDAGQEIALMGGTGVQRSAPHLHLTVRDPQGTPVDVEKMFGRTGTTKPCPPARPGQLTAKLLAQRAKKRRRAEHAAARALAAADRALRRLGEQPPEVELAVAGAAPGAGSPMVVDHPLAQGTAIGSSPIRLRGPEPIRKPDQGRAVPPPKPKPAGPPGIFTLDAPRHRCGVRKQEEDFESGRYRAHRMRLELLDKGRVGVTLARTEGTWHPRLRVLDVDGDELYDGRRKKNPPPGLRIRPGHSGRKGSLAALTLTARHEITLILEFSAWSEGEKPPEPPPRDAAYRLRFERFCRKR